MLKKEEQIINGYKSIYTTDEIGLIQGEYVAYYPEGKSGGIYKRLFLKDGKRDGSYEEWWENGRQKMKCAYKNKDKDGLYEEWYESGQKRWKCTYKLGKLDGLYEEWDEKGHLTERTVFRGGVKLSGDELEKALGRFEDQERREKEEKALEEKAFDLETEAIVWRRRKSVAAEEWIAEHEAHQMTQRRVSVAESEIEVLKRQIAALEREKGAAQTMANLRAAQEKRTNGTPMAEPCEAEKKGLQKLDDETYVMTDSKGMTFLALPSGKRAADIFNWGDRHKGEPFNPKDPDVRLTTLEKEFLEKHFSVDLTGARIYDVPVERPGMIQALDKGKWKPTWLGPRKTKPKPQNASGGR